jgi:hypothetical protein
VKEADSSKMLETQPSGTQCKNLQEGSTLIMSPLKHWKSGRLHLKCDGTRAESRFRISAKRTSPFKSAGLSVQSTTGSRGACISGHNAGYTMFQISVKGTGYPLLSPVSPSLPLPCVTMCHHTSTGLYCTKLFQVNRVIFSLICQSFYCKNILHIWKM